VSRVIEGMRVDVVGKLVRIWIEAAQREMQRLPPRLVCYWTRPAAKYLDSLKQQGAGMTESEYAHAIEVIRQIGFTPQMVYFELPGDELPDAVNPKLTRNNAYKGASK
jgi:hypothetical protein